MVDTSVFYSPAQIDVSIQGALYFISFYYDSVLLSKLVTRPFGGGIGWVETASSPSFGAEYLRIFYSVL